MHIYIYIVFIDNQQPLKCQVRQNNVN